MSPDDRARLRRTLSAFDGSALVALANKGLVRRAERDLQAGGISIEETEAALLVRGPGWTVTMPPDGPARATDDTRASGITRQILTATMFLRDSWEVPCGAGLLARTSSEATDPGGPGDPLHETDGAGALLEQRLVAISMADLRKWAGKTRVAEALLMLDPPPAIEVETHAGLLIRLAQLEFEARLLPTAAQFVAPKGIPARVLDEVLTTAPRASHKRCVVVAVLALQQKHGKTQTLKQSEPLKEPRGSPRSREQLLADSRTLLEGMILTGLAHPSERMTQRLLTLSVSTAAANLPRLARLLRLLADDVSLVLSRDAQADSWRLFSRMSYAQALAAALGRSVKSPPPALVGQHRTEYEIVGDLELAGVGAWPWQSATGFSGVTLMFWDRAACRVLTWTISRPSTDTGPFCTATAYRSEPLWSAGSLERMSRSQFTLRQARSNSLGRLSGSKATSVGRMSPTVPEELNLGEKCFTNWAVLEEYARMTLPAGLADPNPLDRIAVLQPLTWGPRTFDELQQRFSWRLLDARGRSVFLTLPWLRVNEAAIEFLESVKPDRDRLTHAVVRIIPGVPMVYEPLSLLSAGTPQGHFVLNPGFDSGLLSTRSASLLERLRRKFGRNRINTVMTADGDDDSPESLPVPAPLPGGMESLFGQLEAALLRLAESGLRRFPDAAASSHITRIRGLCDRSGLQTLARALDELLPAPSPPALLWCGYLCQIHRQAALRADTAVAR